MPEAERRAVLAELADRLFDLDGFDRETLANIEELTTRIPTEEQSTNLFEWLKRLDEGSEPTLPCTTPDKTVQSAVQDRPESP